jgi:hypothetical protein
VAALEDPVTIDLSPAVVGKPAPLRSAGFPTTMFITHFVLDLVNIQDTEDTETVEKKVLPTRLHYSKHHVLGCKY